MYILNNDTQGERGGVWEEREKERDEASLIPIFNIFTV